MGRPCRARSQHLWRVDDLPIRQACRFVPEGEPLPAQSGWHMDPMPDGFAVCRQDHLPTVRAHLAHLEEEM